MVSAKSESSYDFLDSQLELNFHNLTIISSMKKKNTDIMENIYIPEQRFVIFILGTFLYLDILAIGSARRVGVLYETYSTLFDCIYDRYRVTPVYKIAEGAEKLEKSNKKFLFYC